MAQTLSSADQQALDDLTLDLEALQDGGDRHLRVIIIALIAAIAAYGRADTLENAQAQSEQIARLGRETTRLVENSFRAGARVQSRILRATADEQFFGIVGAVAAAEHANVVMARTPAVLRGRLDSLSEAFVANYSTLVAQIAITSGYRDGIELVGTTGNAVQKMFVRVLTRKEPREHSALEGEVIGRDELWDIGGFLVPSPAHPDLPLSERIHCGHANVYFTPE